MFATSTYVRSDDVVARMIGGETLIVPVRGNVGDLASIYSLNEIASVVWEAAARPVAVTELVGLVTQKYEVEREQAQRDIEIFLAEMTAAGLVKADGAEGREGAPQAKLEKSSASKK